MKTVFFIAIFTLSVFALKPWNNPPTGELPEGVTHHTYRSALYDVDVGYCIYLPPSYEKSTKKYPVLYFNGGTTNIETTQPDKWAQRMHPWLNNNDFCEMIIVYPNPRGVSRYCGETEQSYIKELVPLVDSLYRTWGSKQKRAISGMSMGGFGALKFAFQYRQLFGSCLTYAAAVTRLYDDNTTIFDYTRTHADSIKAAGIPLRMVIGDKDHLYEPNLEYFALLDSIGIGYEKKILPGVDHVIEIMVRDEGIYNFSWHCKHFSSQHFNSFSCREHFWTIW